MALSRRAVIGGGVLAASAAATTGVVVFRDNPAVRGLAGDVTTLKGFAGGEKMAFIENPRTVKALKGFGLAMQAERAGSIEQVRDDAYISRKPDFVWPSSAPLVELAKQKLKVVRDQVIFNSPIVIYSWAPIADGLVRAGLATKEGRHYGVDAHALIAAVLAAKPWSELGQTDLYGRVRMIATDPNKSNSGFMFAGLAANLLAGDVADETSLPKVLPDVVRLFRGMGFKSHSSGAVFDDFIAGGPGAQPLVVGYENQLVEWILADTERWKRVEAAAGTAQPVTLYPRPTVFSAHPLLALSPKSPPLIDALMSKGLQEIGWRDHGFRGPLGAVGAETSPLVAGRMPGQVTQVVPMPDISTMLKILDALAAP
jgi:hypothetical protein